MSEVIKQHYIVDGTDFTRAGEASGKIKKTLKDIGFPPQAVRNTAIAVYEAEINLVIHAGGGEIDVEITPEYVKVVLTDHGPGIENVELAMQEGYSTAPDRIRALGFGAGMGLPNIKKYSDEMDIQTELGVGTVMTLKINA
ncbi:MAG: anti-sigma regulatory factor [Clostridia bacterium]|nr:anti-sigma regulatory factor [Clostridia bacterium]